MRVDFDEAKRLLAGTNNLRFFRGAMYDKDADEYLRQLHHFLSSIIEQEGASLSLSNGERSDGL